MHYTYCQSTIFSPSELKATALLAMKRRDSYSSNYADTQEALGIRLAVERLESMGIFALNPANGVRCEFTVPYADSEYLSAFEMVRTLAGRVNSVRAEVSYETRVETSQGIAELKYGTEIIHNSNVKGFAHEANARFFKASVGYRNVFKGVNKDGRNEAIRNEFFRILTATGLDDEVSLQEEHGEFRVLFRGPYDLGREPLSPLGLSIANFDTFEKAMAFQEKALSTLPEKKLEVDFYCSMDIEDYECFREEYADMLRPWMIDGYGRLHDWVKPFAPLDDLPPDAPKEIPIFQQWDSDLKLFTLGRILRTAEGLRLLVYTNKGDAKRLAKRMKEATGVDFTVVDRKQLR